MNSTLVTTASVKWTGLVASNSAAKAWCALNGNADANKAMPVTTAATVNLAAIKRFSSISYQLFLRRRIAGNIAFVNLFSGRNLARDVHVHGLAFPMLHQLVLAQMPI